MVSLRESTKSEPCWDEAAEAPSDRGLDLDGSDKADWLQSKNPVSALIRTLEGEIIPRLLVAHRTKADYSGSPAPDARRPGPEDVAAFTKIILSDDVSAATAYANRLLVEGVALDTLLLDLFAPAARRLGDFWMEDLCDFTQVTLGVGRLQQLLREFARPVRPEIEICDQGRRVLLAPTPDEQHTFGMLVVGEFLRRAGWDVTGEPAASRNELCSLVHDEWFAVIGLSLSSEARIRPLTQAIRAIRRASRNDTLGVMVGGKLFVEHPELVQRVGADGTAEDGNQAVQCAEELLAHCVSNR